MLTFMLLYITYSPEVSSLVVELIYESDFPVLFSSCFLFQHFLKQNILRGNSDYVRQRAVSLIAIYTEPKLTKKMELYAIKHLDLVELQMKEVYLGVHKSYNFSIICNKLFLLILCVWKNKQLVFSRRKY